MTPDIHVEATAGRVGWIAAAISLLIIPVNGFVGIKMTDSRDEAGGLALLFTLLAITQFFAGLIALVSGIRTRRRTHQRGIGRALMGAVGMVGAPFGWLLGMVMGAALGGAWGRPLRVRGRQVHPNLKEGADWTLGDRPDPSSLTASTRRALEALWLHDAQKEHASVPAFARISWMLAAVGAPAELMEWSHRAALEEIAHTRLCFALAAGYAGRSHTVEPMPDLLVGGLEVRGNPLAVLAAESLGDGCQLEDYNADVASACAIECEEPVTRRVLEQVAREERSHADFSWALVTWLLERDRAVVQPVLEKGLAALENYRRPTAVSADKRSLVAAAEPEQLLRHGRLPDARWGQLWDARLVATRRRIQDLLAQNEKVSVNRAGGSLLHQTRVGQMRVGP